MSEKTEKATTYQLQKAKENGFVNKSAELNNTLLLLIMLSFSTLLWPLLVQQIKMFITQLLHLATQLCFNSDKITTLQRIILLKLIHLWMPFASIHVLCLILTTIVQTGFVWSVKSLRFDLKRLHIKQGIKRLGSTKSIFQAVISSLKLASVALFMSIEIHHALNLLIQLMNHGANESTTLFHHLVVRFSVHLILLLLAFACIDKFYTHRNYLKKNRMSKQEIKDEYRQREGDPRIKFKMRKLQQQLRQKISSLERIKTADVIVVNPMHLAIALKYQRGSMPAPQVVYKAQGELVKQVKRIAKRHQIPIVHNKLFAKQLFKTVSLNQWIHPEHFPMAALIFNDLYRQREIAL